MSRPRTSDGFRPPLPERRKIAYAQARRWYAPFVRLYPEDVRQIVWLISLTWRKHLKPAQFRRMASREIYQHAKAYGFRRVYASGNQKEPLRKMEV